MNILMKRLLFMTLQYFKVTNIYLQKYNYRKVLPNNIILVFNIFCDILRGNKLII